MHDFGRDPADHSSYDQVNKKVHFDLLCEGLSWTEYSEILLIQKYQII
jgi:hypothetical protein